MCEMNERNVCIIQWLFCLKCGYAYEYMYPNVKIGWHMYVEEWGMESRLPVSQSVSRSFSLPNEGYETGTLWKLLHVICHVHGSKRRDWTHALAHSLTHISNRRNEEKTGRIISFFSLSSYSICMMVNRKYITCIAIRDAINNRIYIYVCEEYVACGFVCACKLVCGVLFGFLFGVFASFVHSFGYYQFTFVSVWFSLA